MSVPFELGSPTQEGGQCRVLGACKASCTPAPSTSYIEARLVLEGLLLSSISHAASYPSPWHVLSHLKRFPTEYRVRLYPSPSIFLVSLCRSVAQTRGCSSPQPSGLRAHNQAHATAFSRRPTPTLTLDIPTHQAS